MKNVLLAVLLVSLVSTSVFSQALYSNTSYSSRFNPGLGSMGTPIVAYDDINIPSTMGFGSDSISITKVNIGIRRAPNAPATNVNLYYTTLKFDSAGNNAISNAPVFLGKVSLPVNGGSLVTSVISLGDSSSALFKISTSANITNNGYKVLIGASFDNPSPANGVVLSKASNNNADSLWIDNSDNHKEMYATSFSSHLPSSYYLQVFGNATTKQAADNKNFYSDVAANTNASLKISK